jgi:hypothetical protein
VGKLFCREKHSWNGGLPVRLFVRAAEARERTALLRLVGMSDSEYKQYWVGRVFRGESAAEAVALFSNGMQKEAVIAYPGALALVSYSDVKPGMKVVKIDGLAPGNSGYPLK